MGGLLLLGSLIAVNIVVYWLLTADKKKDGVYSGFLGLKQTQENKK